MDKIYISLTKPEAAVVVAALAKYINDLHWDIECLTKKVAELKAGAKDGTEKE